MLRDEPRAKGERPALGHVIAPFFRFIVLLVPVVLVLGSPMIFK